MGLENCGIYFFLLHVSYLASIKLEHFELPYFGSKFLEESHYTLTCFVLNDFRGKWCLFLRFCKRKGSTAIKSQIQWFEKSFAISLSILICFLLISDRLYLLQWPLAIIDSHEDKVFDFLLSTTLLYCWYIYQIDSSNSPFLKFAGIMCRLVEWR